MTEVNIVNCSCFSEHELFLEGMGRLSCYRQKKVNQAKSPQAKYQRLAAGVLLDFLLRERGLAEKDMEYTKDSFGKPIFANRSDLYFNLSHSGDWAICALSDETVGADVQVISDYSPRVAARCFAKQDAHRLSRLTGEEQKREFTRLWVQKESCVKYFGTWKGQETPPPVTEYLEIDEVRIGVCTYDTSVFRYIKDVSEIL